LAMVEMAEFDELTMFEAKKDVTRSPRI